MDNDKPILSSGIYRMTSGCGGPTNNDRASWANTALSAFVNEVATDDEDDKDMMCDLLCNIRHLADAQGWDIEKMWAGSASPYSEEIDEQPKADADFSDC